MLRVLLTVLFVVLLLPAGQAVAGPSPHCAPSPSAVALPVQQASASPVAATSHPCVDQAANCQSGCCGAILVSVVPPVRPSVRLLALQPRVPTGLLYAHSYPLLRPPNA